MPAFDPIAFGGLAFDELAAVSSGVFGFLPDPFDSLLNADCFILENQGGVDSYGQKSDQVRTFATIAVIRCYVSTDAPGRPHEFKTDTRQSLDYARVFMRVPSLPDDEPLTTHHWLKIDDDYYDIFNILNPGMLNHHLEVICELITP
jgi:hypothetical protein